MSTADESQYEPEGPQRAVPGALLVFSGTVPQLRTVILPAKGALVLGRENIGGAPVPDERMSKQHCELAFEGGQFTVTPTGKNATLINGVQAQTTQRAEPGSLLRLADSIFLLLGDVRRFVAGTVATHPRIVGPTYKLALDQIAMAGRSDASVLICGENGAGKEFAAKIFHDAATPKGAFIPINCANVPNTLAEPELFGSRKGSHSEAKEDRLGKVEAADGGVLFLDELGTLDIDVQAKLLRTVETNELTPLGATKPVKVKVRYVCATNQDLRAEVAAGTFRQDLFHRLAQVEVMLPALRERREEIPWLLADVLAGQRLHPSLVEVMMMRPWPGNVRELVNQTKAAIATAQMKESPVVRPEHLSPRAGIPITGTHPRAHAPAPAQPPAPAASPEDKHSFEQVSAALEATGGNISQAARNLGIAHRNTLVRLIQKYGLKPRGLQQEDDGEEP